MPRGCGGAVVIFTLAAASAASGQPASITFARDVAPIVFAKCAGCHRDGGDAPFSLTTFEQVSRHAKTIRAVTATRYMPPWKPQPGFGEFHGDRRLTDVQIGVIERWITDGMPIGDPRDLPPPPPAVEAWLQGPPDVVLRLPEFLLRADGPDVFRNFVVTKPQVSQRFVRAWHFRPRTVAVHHANIRIDRTPASRRLDEADPAPGYEGVILRSADFPDGHFLGWTPGQAPPRVPDAAAWPIDRGVDFVVQLHMRPTGKPERVAPLIGLYLTDAPPRSPPSMIRLGRQQLAIPGGAAQHTVSDSFVLPVDVDVHAIQAHSHYRARTVHAWAQLPDGSRRELLRINDWDPAWQDRYEYRSPITLPAMTTLITEYVFNNSADNPRNPTQPPQLAEWGWRTIDEMADVWLQVTTRADRDRGVLRAAARHKMQTEDAIGTEALIAREPNRVDLRNDAGAIYMALGRPHEALRHFREAKRLQPSAVAAFNVGVALEANGDLKATALEYAEAVRLDPDYSAAHNNYGSLLMRDGHAAEAHDAFVRAVTANPDNAEARANLALTSITRGQPDAAEQHVMAAIRLRPERATQYLQFVRLLAAGDDAAQRRPAAACRIAEAIVAASSHQDAAALAARTMACR
jgi:tetratricopeptide (TPR) repeat protein